MYSKCLIFGAGDLYTNEVCVESDTIVIAADGGLKHTERLRIKPDVVLGDFDSFDIEKAPKNKIVYPSEKDYTDMFLAVEYGLKLGVKHFEIYGGLGGKRIDHTIANIQMLEHFVKKNCQICLHVDNQVITAFIADKNVFEIYFPKECSGYISLFALGGNIDKVSITGLKYELSDYTLMSSFPVGVSNEFVSKDSKITFSLGTLLLVTEKQNIEKINFTEAKFNE